MISVRSQNIDEFQLIRVIEDLERRGIQHADIYEGNGCIWVARSSAINEYYIFRDGYIADIQID